MHLLAFILVIALSALGVSCNHGTYNCGQLNILFVGFPAYHPAVIDQEWDPAQVDKGLKSQLLELAEAGYNIKEVWFGPEKGAQPMLDSFKDRRWDGVIVGFGVRGGNTVEVTHHFEKLVNGVRVNASHAALMFNYNPTSTLEAAQRTFPLPDCANHPGKNYGEHIHCDKSVCTTAPDGWTGLKGSRVSGPEERDL